MILTSPENYLTLTRAVHQTWASRCDQHFFISEPSQENITNEQKQFAKEISIAPIHDIKFGYDKLIQKMTLAFLFAYKNYFIIVENLRDFLRKQDASEPVTFGYNYKVIVSY